jgi:hypothetical protein
MAPPSGGSLGTPGIDLGAGLSERIKILEDTLKDIQDEMTSTSVQVGTVTFTTRSQVKACWMDVNCCPEWACLFFLDAM